MSKVQDGFMHVPLLWLSHTCFICSMVYLQEDILEATVSNQALEILKFKEDKVVQDIYKRKQEQELYDLKATVDRMEKEKEEKALTYDSLESTLAAMGNQSEEIRKLHGDGTEQLREACKSIYEANETSTLNGKKWKRDLERVHSTKNKLKKEIQKQRIKAQNIQKESIQILLQQDRCSTQLDNIQKAHQQLDSFKENINFYEAELHRKNGQISNYKDLFKNMTTEKDRLRQGNRDLAEHLFQVKEGAWKHINDIETAIVTLKEGQKKLECDVEFHQNAIKIENMITAENLEGIQEAISQLKDELIKNVGQQGEAEKVMQQVSFDMGYLKTMLDDFSLRQLQIINTQDDIADKIKSLTSDMNNTLASDRENKISFGRLMLNSATPAKEYKHI